MAALTLWRAWRTQTLRQYFAEHIVDWYEHGAAIGHGILYSLGGREYDPLELSAEYVRLQRKIAEAVIDLPGTVQAKGPLSPALHNLWRMVPCPACKAAINERCVNRFLERTGPHRRRRAAADAAADLRGDDDAAASRSDGFDVDHYGDHQYDGVDL